MGVLLHCFVLCNALPGLSVVKPLCGFGALNFKSSAVVGFSCFV